MVLASQCLVGRPISAESVLRSEVPAALPLSRSRSLGDVYRANTRYGSSQFAPTQVPIGLASKPINVYHPYWTYTAYWPYRQYRNFYNYENYITDSFYWHQPFHKWTSYKHNWYHYDSPYFYRRYHDYYNTFYDAELNAYGNRSKLAENLYQSTPMTQ